MEIARKNTARAGLQIDFRQGNSSDMLFKEHTFDFTFCQADFKNFSEPVKAIAEVYRVWCPSGLSITADLRRDASAEDIEREIQAMGLGHINEFMVRWTFKNMLLKKWVDREKNMALSIGQGHVLRGGCSPRRHLPRAQVSGSVGVALPRSDCARHASQAGRLAALRAEGSQ